MKELSREHRSQADILIEYYKLGTLVSYFREHIEELVVSLATAYETAYQDNDHKSFVIGSLKILLSQHEECLDFISTVDSEKVECALLIIAGKLYDEGMQLIRNNDGTPQGS